MIELVIESACVECGICVKVCPNDIFEATDDGVPVIARQEDCHTCFLCEAYCPVDALYVSPLSIPDPVASAEKAAGFRGSYRRAIGWGKDLPKTAPA